MISILIYLATGIAILLLLKIDWSELIVADSALEFRMANSLLAMRLSAMIGGLALLFLINKSNKRGQSKYPVVLAIVPISSSI